jgi:Ca2+-binding RTX toxin-like protein
MTKQAAVTIGSIALLAALVTPAAQAATVRTAENRVIVVAAPGETNAITIAPGGSGFVISDSAGAPAPGRGCTAAGGATTCSGAGITALFVDADDGNDTVTNDTALTTAINGGPGNDTINGGSGDDTIKGNAGADTIHSGAGNDTITTRGDVPDAVFCGPGDDTVHEDIFDRVVKDPADPEACEHFDNAAPPTAPGSPPPPPPPGPGQAPFIVSSPPGTPLPVPAAALGAPLPSASTGRCATPFIGTATADRIDGTDVGDRIFGMAGNDVLSGLKGDDCIFGLGGNDQEFGGPGDDKLHALADDNRIDTIDCGDGNDLAYENANERDVFVNCETVIRKVPTPAEAADDNG